ncbi:hypothetical protein PILCRDRAFT_809956 [Piloderma croceum F 1598]|uniref:F-box domain-containing protein n=1 Tax=Piloderma croceum (strain F 1598) TaxID=765440 RepID=A0A0C3GK11_PILCF|nr:hypothetical protein PILCRDRAFT_809956 [Piloderma croceum F 1598]
MLATELLQAVVSEVAAEADDLTDLLNLRLVNSTFSSLATPKVFQTIRVYFTNESAQRMVDFLKSSRLVQYLEEIEIYVEAEDSAWLMLAMPDGWIKILDQGFQAFDMAPRLRTVLMTFPANRDEGAMMSVEQDSMFQSILLLGLATSMSIPTIPELILDNWISLASNKFITGSRLRYMPPTTKLHIHTQRYVMARMGFNDEIPLAFWKDTLPNYMLKPCTPVLTSLTISSDMLDGYGRHFDLSNVFFPFMIALSLDKVLFGNITNVEDFIICHADSLETLKLLTCSVYTRGGNDEPNIRPWAHTWTRFAEELHELRSITVDQFPKESGAGLGSMRYIFLTGYTQLLPEKDEFVDLDRDDIALDALRDVVKTRLHGERTITERA